MKIFKIFLTSFFLINFLFFNSYSEKQKINQNTKEKIISFKKFDSNEYNLLFNLQNRFNENNFNINKLMIDLSILSRKNKKTSKFLKNFFEENPEWLGLWFHFGKSKIDTTPRQLNSLLQAFLELDINPSMEWLEDFYSISISKLGTFSPFDLSMLIHNFALLDITPSKNLLNELFLQTKQKLSTFQNEELSRCLYALALLNIHPDRSFITLLNRDFKNRKLEKTGEIRNLTKFKYFLEMNNLDDFYFTYTKKAKINAKKQQTTISPFQKDVINHLMLLLNEDEIIKEEKWIDTIFNRVDIFLPNMNLVIEVDGPQHFLKNNTLTPQSILQTELLQYAGYNVIRIPYFEWNILKSQRARENYLFEMLFSNNDTFPQENTDSSQKANFDLLSENSFSSEIFC